MAVEVDCEIEVLARGKVFVAGNVVCLEEVICLHGAIAALEAGVVMDFLLAVPVVGVVIMQKFSWHDFFAVKVQKNEEIFAGRICAGNGDVVVEIA